MGLFNNSYSRLVDVKNFSLSIDGRMLINNCSFSISRGDVIAIIGKNGSGKTTLVRSIIGLDDKYDGIVSRIEGLRMSYMPQNIDIPEHIPITVGHFIGMQVQNIDTSLLDRLHIMEIMNNQLRHVSGGEMQKIVFFISISIGSDLIVLDEPENHVDEDLANVMLDVVTQFKEKAFVIISHDHQKVLQYSNHVLDIGEYVVCRNHTDCLS